MNAPANGRLISGTCCEGRIHPLGIEALPPRLGWQMGAGRRGMRQTAYQVQVAGTPEALAGGAPDLWDSGKVSSDRSVLVPYEGSPLVSRQRCWWRVRVWDESDQAGEFSDPDWWEMGLLKARDWSAKWIGRPDVCLISSDKPVLPAPLFRKRFELSGPLRRARAYVCGLGYYELYLNGRKVGDHVLDPVVTQYERRLRYVTYDIQEYLVPGANVAGVILGNGWYNCHTPEVWHFDKAPWRDYPKLLLQIEVEMEDGGSYVLRSDRNWKVADGPIRFDGLRNGETYDARCEAEGWLAPDYDDRAWTNAEIIPEPGGLLKAQQAPPCKVTQTLTPKALWPVRPGVVVYDLGQNTAGWAQLRASGAAGTEITLRYAEMLDAERDINQKNVSPYIKGGDFQTDRYVLKGQGAEVWEPRFTYHGFRYVQVTGHPNPPQPENVRGRVVHTAFEPAGRFECSNELLNRLQSCALWSFRSNFVGIPTDCPHREKNGWTGDAHLAAESLLMNFTVAPAHREWIQTLADTQRLSGQLPGIAPSAGWGFNWGSGPAWDSALFLIPWYIYLYTGDSSALEECYPAMLRYLGYCERMAEGHIVSFGLGDWLHPESSRMAPVALTSTAFYYADSRIAARTAELLGRKTDARRCARLAQRIRRAFQKRFSPANDQFVAGEQTADGISLHFGLTADSRREAVLSRLVAAIASNGGRLDAGILGAKYILRALAEGGRADLAYALLTRTDFPSWGLWVEQGATTLCEDWKGASSQYAGSLNHVAFGDISAWMYSWLAGIAPDPEQPGFKRILIQPHPAGDLTRVSAEHRSPYGLIRSAWTREGSDFALDVAIPPNATARIVLPSADLDGAREGGRPLKDAPGLSASPTPAGIVIAVGSGDYRFTCRLPAGDFHP